MSDKLYLIRFKGSELSFHAVIAARAEIHGEHLVFLRSDGKLAALFLLEIIEKWSEFELYSASAWMPSFSAIGTGTLYSANLFDSQIHSVKSNSHDGNTSDVFYFFSISPASAGYG